MMMSEGKKKERKTKVGQILKLKKMWVLFKVELINKTSDLV